MRKLIFFVLISLLAIWGCSTEDNPAEPQYSEGRGLTGFINSTSIGNTILIEPSGRQVYVYEPANYTQGDVDSVEIYIDSTQTGGFHYDTTYISYTVTSAEYPTLYLLHGYGGDSEYYEVLFLLESILNEMIATGEIIPMLVITPDCDTQLGGSFYANSPLIGGNSFAGLWEDFISQDLIAYVNDKFNADTTAAMRAISGHSMGGYGAITLAMKNPSLYGSVSSMSAPLSFRHFSGLIQPMLAENGITMDSVQSDTANAWFYSLEPTSSRRLTSMMFAMGAAFSPYDYMDTTNTDTTFFHRLADVAVPLGVNLPINYDAEWDTTSSVWTQWAMNDPVSMLSMGYADSLMGKAIYIDAGAEDDFGFDQHLSTFSAALTSAGITHTSEEYTGYDGNPADHATYIANRLRMILKFHSDYFQEQMAQ